MTEQEEILKDFVEITLPEDQSFLKVKETLTRIGVASVQKGELYQSVHILHKRGRYFLPHFKEMFALDGKPTNFSEEDKARRNTIANLMADWGLVKLVDPVKTKDPVAPMNKIKVIPYKEKDSWKLISKYSIGTKKARIAE